VRVQTENLRNLAISAQLERLQAGVQTSLLLVEQTGEQDNRPCSSSETLPAGMSTGAAAL
jgi:hypothetical protein